MTDEKRTEPEQVKPSDVEQVKQQADVKQALKQTSTVKAEDTPKAETKDKLWLGTHFIILIALAAFRYLLQLNILGLSARHPRYTYVLEKLDLAAMAVILLLVVAKLSDVYLIGRLDSPVSRYNLDAGVAAGRDRHLHSIFKLVHDAGFSWFAVTHHGFGGANTRHQFSRLDLHSRPRALSRRRSNQDRGRDR